MVTESYQVSAAAVAHDERAYASRTFCSWAESGWRSVPLRCRDNAPLADDVVLPALPDQAVVLVTSGQSLVESHHAGSWSRAHYVPGRVAMTQPGRPARLRWRPIEGVHRTAHLYLPGRLMADTAERVFGTSLDSGRFPDALMAQDQVTETVMYGLLAAAQNGADDMYAESAAAYLAMHLLSRNAIALAGPVGVHGDPRIRSVVEFMHENLSLPLTLSQLAQHVRLSSFHFLRLFKSVTGATPSRYLTRLRVAAARRYLERGSQSVTEIAFLTGFSGLPHLSRAFHRETGMTPSAYRAAKASDRHSERNERQADSGLRT